MDLMMKTRSRRARRRSDNAPTIRLFRFWEPHFDLIHAAIGGADIPGRAGSNKCVSVRPGACPVLEGQW
jgi:hypothetical protein